MNNTNDYRKIATEAGLLGARKDLYVDYMNSRWPMGVAPDYAKEWAERFLLGHEYQSSDIIGQNLLNRLQGREF